MGAWKAIKSSGKRVQWGLVDVGDVVYVSGCPTGVVSKTDVDTDGKCLGFEIDNVWYWREPDSTVVRLHTAPVEFNIHFRENGIPKPADSANEAVAVGSGGEVLARLSKSSRGNWKIQLCGGKLQTMKSDAREAFPLVVDAMNHLTARLKRRASCIGISPTLLALR